MQHAGFAPFSTIFPVTAITPTTSALPITQRAPTAPRARPANARDHDHEQDGGARFPPDERGFLLAEPRIGQGVVERLEAVGVHSLAQLAAVGPAAVVRRICEGQGTLAWTNRRKALERALQRSRQIGLCPVDAAA